MLAADGAVAGVATKAGRSGPTMLASFQPPASWTAWVGGHAGGELAGESHAAAVRSPIVGARRRLTQLTLFASSTSEAAAEVSALRKVIEGLNKLLESTHAITLRMLAWPDDIRPGVNTDAQSEINRQVAGYDIYLGLLGTRFGTPTPRGESGTQEEFEAALSRFSSDTTSVRLLFYFKKSLVGINPYELDVEGLQKVQRFRDNIKARGVLSRDFDNTEDFIDLVKTHVVDLIAKEWRSETERWAPADAPAQPPALVREQPRAGLDTTSGDAARPKSRASESKKSAPPDEDDLEDADEDGLGLLTTVP